MRPFRRGRAPPRVRPWLLTLALLLLVVPACATVEGLLSGALAALSGVMISSLSGLLPTMGADPMLKAFVICVVAGLGNVSGAALAALALGVLEALIQYLFGVQYAFAILLALVIAVLIWRPAGLFGKIQVVRL
jgi:branched-subunit amino acid ABC-type transport system permease component